MFDIKVLDSIKTVGAFILYEKTVAFMIGPDKTGNRLGIMRIGGHIEQGENLFQALEREIREEAAINVKLINSPKTYYKTKWDDINLELVPNIDMPLKPLLIAGDIKRSTAVFLSETRETPVPSSEAYGIVFLNEQNIRDICNKKMLLKDYLHEGGKLVQQKDLNLNMEIYAGPHMRAMYELLQSDDDSVRNFLRGSLY